MDTHISLRKMFTTNQYQQDDLFNPRDSVRDILDGIDYAFHIQKSILPEGSSLNKHFEQFILFKPKEVVGGDFYWMDELNSKYISICADCTGHGVPGALLTMLGYQMIENITRDMRIFDPGEILNHLHRQFLRIFSSEGALTHQGMDVSVCVYDLDKKTLAYACAKSNILMEINNELYRLKGSHVSIGDPFNKEHLYTTKYVSINQPAWMFQFTDGIIDQFGGERDKKFKLTNLKKLLDTNLTLHSKEYGETIWESLKFWKESKDQTDDITLIGTRLK
ncbi:MAG: SpoIIE family protein phosphatase [Crocinitomicaceae bacterium]|nr:SpoIIE family protein phosphatase [Crocinitomicaceae bacterium]